MPSLSLTLDIVSLLLCGTIILSGVGFGLAGRGRDARYLRLWALGAALVASAILMIILRAVLPDWLSILVANLMVTAGYGCLSAGMRAFSGRGGFSLDIGFGGISSAAFFLAYVFGAGLDVRVIINSITVLGYTALILPGLKGLPNHWMILIAQATYYSVIVTSVLRTIAALYTPNLVFDLLNSLVLVSGVVIPLQVALLVFIFGQRRLNMGRLPMQEADDAEGEWRLAQARGALLAPSGTELRLTGAEYLVLQQLAGSETSVPRSVLNGLIGRDVDNPKDRGIDILISRLRRKCMQAGVALPITAVRGQGYVFHGRLLVA